MVFIHDKLNSSVSKKIPSSEIWKHLTELYDLQALVSSYVEKKLLPSHRYCIVSIHVYSASYSADQSEALPVREIQREDSISRNDMGK